MQHRPLGRTGLQVSVVGFGGSPIGSVFRPVPQAEADTAVRTALELGINYFDTAPYYGNSAAEQALGHALRGVPRDRFVLASKVGRYGAGEFDFSAARVTRSVDESLARLGGGHLDVVQVHDMEFGSLEQIWAETLPALDRLKAAGKVRAVGITGLPLATLRRVQQQAPRLIDTVLSYCHGTLNDATFLPYARELRAGGFGVLNAAPLAMGLLTSGPLPDWHPAPAAVRAAAAEAAEFCTQHGVQLADVAMAFAFGRPEFDCTIVGLASATEVRRAVDCVTRPPNPTVLAGVQSRLASIQGVTWPSGRPENN